MPDFTVIPSIEQLRQRPAIRVLEARFGADATVDALRETAAGVRRAIANGERLDADAVVARVESDAAVRLGEAFRPSLAPVINATGVIIHTNLGRAPLAAEAIARVAGIARGYSSLEYDVARGARGRRDVHAETLLCRLTGAEAAVVVNNNAAATMIVLAAIAAGREVLVSRGELVEIGGGFRVPDVMAQSGAVLREVGTTNKTRASDYAAAIGERTALILRVHPSNFRIEGFTERPALTDLVTLGQKFAIPIAEDLGSGYLGDGVGTEQGQSGDRVGTEQGQRGDGVGTEQGQSGDRVGTEQGRSRVRPRSVPHEPAVPDSVAAGVDLCCFSGDKLLGGPQAGIIVGRRSLVDRIRAHPLMRALRVDKMTYAALEATLTEYVAGRAASTIPVQRMLTLTADDIRARARTLAATLNGAGWRAEIIDGSSAIGGGSAPGIELPTALLAIERRGVTAAALGERLRRLQPPVIARIEQDRVLLDLRTVLPDDDEPLARALTEMERANP